MWGKIVSGKCLILCRKENGGGVLEIECKLLQLLNVCKHGYTAYKDGQTFANIDLAS